MRGSEKNCKALNIYSFIAKIDYKLRPLASALPPSASISFYSAVRREFIKRFARRKNVAKYSPPPESMKKLWGIEFAGPLFNAAGMFKYGDGYELCAAQGAGAFLAGTTTPSPRKGNHKFGILHPFAPYPKSGAASNWMGLPNPGADYIAKKLSKIEKIPGVPVGISVSADPEDEGKRAVENLVASMKMFEDAGADFIEMNESCPNAPRDSFRGAIGGQDAGLAGRLERVAETFLKRRKKRTPVVVKFSNDIEEGLLSKLIELLIHLNFDGINIGNTSTKYEIIADQIDSGDRDAFDFFSKTFGGGVSGVPLKYVSLQKAAFAAKYVEMKEPKNEFRVIRTGGIDSASDLLDSTKAGVAMNQWYTGYFSSFARCGDSLYKDAYGDI